MKKTENRSQRRAEERAAKKARKASNKTEQDLSVFLSLTIPLIQSHWSLTNSYIDPHDLNSCPGVKETPSFIYNGKEGEIMLTPYKGGINILQFNLSENDENVNYQKSILESLICLFVLSGIKEIYSDEIPFGNSTNRLEQSLQSKWSETLSSIGFTRVSDKKYKLTMPSQLTFHENEIIKLPFEFDIPESVEEPVLHHREGELTVLFEFTPNPELNFSASFAIGTLNEVRDELSEGLRKMELEASSYGMDPVFDMYTNLIKRTLNDPSETLQQDATSLLTLVMLLKFKPALVSEFDLTPIIPIIKILHLLYDGFDKRFTHYKIIFDPQRMRLETKMCSYYEQPEYTHYDKSAA